MERDENKENISPFDWNLGLQRFSEIDDAMDEVLEDMKIFVLSDAEDFQLSWGVVRSFRSRRKFYCEVLNSGIGVLEENERMVLVFLLPHDI